jgi:hypothetical protein
MLSTIEKTQRINFDFPDYREGRPVSGPINYRGAIAEIGAGQEVARAFFQAFGTSNTIVKTMSAYGKGCSDAIYGPVPGRQPYISESRLRQMIEHDYSLLVERSLKDDEAPSIDRQLHYFAFANTVDINEHGWAGVRVQQDGNSMLYESHTALDFRIHFNCIEGDKQSRMRVVGALGVNLIYAALEYARGNTNVPLFTVSLVDGIEISDLRVDSIAIEKVRVEMEMVSQAEKRYKANKIVQLESPLFAEESQRIGIELVKNSLVHCATFNEPTTGPIGGYYSFGYLPEEVTNNKSDPRPLLLTRSACDDPLLEIERTILDAARKAFARDVSKDYKATIAEDQIQVAIQLPVLAVSKSLTELSIYIDRDHEPPKHREDRLAALRDSESELIAARIDNVVRAGYTALLTEFLNTSELVKFLRSWTRLKPNPKRSVVSGTSSNIAFVFRTDQFIELLLNIHERVIDRDVLELTGSVARRKTRVYIYPCCYDTLLSASTRYGTPLVNAFRDSETLSEMEGLEPNVASLSRELRRDYTALIEYYASRCMIKDLPVVARSEVETKNPSA